MTLDEAIERHRKGIADLKDTSRHKMSMYQTGHIEKEQHNEIQSAINREIRARQLGIEALKQLKVEREWCVGFWKDRLPGETEK